MLAGCRLGGYLEWHAVLSSTMDRAADLAGEGAPDGAVVVADQQRSGRGRLGRSWQAEAGQALTFSLLLRPAGHLGGPGALAQLPMALALGALEALRIRLPQPQAAALKWPNDLQLDGAKVGGLLAELRQETEGTVLILGLGLNLRQRDFPTLPDATSLSRHLGCEPTDPRLRRVPLLADLLRAAAVRLEVLEQGGSLLADWAAQLSTLGRRIRVRPLGGQVAGPGVEPCLEGLAEGLGPLGELLLRDDFGRLHLLRAGDVSLAAE